MSDVAVGVDPAADELRAVGQEYRRAMGEGDSVFTPGHAIWTAPNADELVAAFVDRPDVGGRSFAEKLADQLDGVSDGALQLFAELWYASLAPLHDYAPNTKRKLIADILDRMQSPVALPEVVIAALRAHAFNGGVAFKTRRPFQLALLVRVAVAVTALDLREREVALSEPRRWKALLDTVLEPKEPAQRKALSWLLFPDYFLSVVSTPHRAAIRAAYADLLDGTEVDEDDELFRIREELTRRDAGHSFYAPPIVDRWDPERRISGVSISPETLSRRKQYKTRGYAIATAAIELIPEGFWSTYSDVAELAGLIPGQVGGYLEDVEHISGHRVIKADGTTYTAENRTVLEFEGIGFNERGVADPVKKISKEDLREELQAGGLLPKLSRRGWLVRGSSVNGRDLVPTWRGERLDLTGRL